MYADGYIYEYELPSGSRVGPCVYDLTLPFFTSRLIRTYEEEGKHYLTLWIPHGEAQTYDKLSQAVARPGLNHVDASEGDPEVLHEEIRLKVSRVRHANGWVYLVKAALGYPWPSYFAVPSLIPTREAPIVSMDQEGPAYTVQYWVADAEPYAPAAA